MKIHLYLQENETWLVKSVIAIISIYFINILAGCEHYFLDKLFGQKISF